MGMLDHMDAPTLPDQDLERKTPIPDSGTARVAICPTSRVAAHFGHTSPAKISIFQGFEGLLLIGKSVRSSPEFRRQQSRHYKASSVALAAKRTA